MGVQEAYKAFGPQMDTYVTPDFINELSGRIWIIDGTSDACYKNILVMNNNTHM